MKAVHWLIQFNSDEAAFGLTYARKLSQELGLGVTATYIRSDIPGKFALIEDMEVGHTVALDMGLYYANGHPIIQIQI